MAASAGPAGGAAAPGLPPAPPEGRVRAGAGAQAASDQPLVLRLLRQGVRQRGLPGPAHGGGPLRGRQRGEAVGDVRPV